MPPSQFPEISGSYGRMFTSWLKPPLEYPLLHPAYSITFSAMSQLRIARGVTSLKETSSMQVEPLRTGPAPGRQPWPGRSAPPMNQSERWNSRLSRE